MKKVTKENAELLCYKIDAEGFDYCFTQYSDWKDETKGTKLAPLIAAYKKAHDELEDAIEELREEYEIEES